MDRGLKRIMRGRLRIAAAMAVAVVVILALPAFAYAATFTGEYPAPNATYHFLPAVVAVDLQSAPPLDASSAHVMIGGVTYKTFVTAAGTVEGRWSSSETANGDGTYRIVWTWAAASGGRANATLYCFPPVGALIDGSRAVTATVEDTAGVAYTDSWRFTVAVAPTLSGAVPAAGTTVASNNPAVSVKVADNSAGAITATATINGVAATATVSGGVISIAHGTLADGTYNVVVTAKDAAGTPATKAWSFGVFAASSPTCVYCHAPSATIAGVPAVDKGDYANDPAMGPNCVSCHSTGSLIPAHGLDGTHTVTVVGGAPFNPSADNTLTACVNCHGNDLHSVHAPGGCACHTYNEAFLNTIIGNGITSKTAPKCTACHSGSYAGHVPGGEGPMHDPVAPASGDTTNTACIGCHTADLPTAHHSVGCACHDGVFATEFATLITNGNAKCTDCHSAQYFPHVPGTSEGSPTPTLHVSATGVKSSACTACHGTDLPAAHSAVLTPFSGITAPTPLTGCACHAAPYATSLAAVITAGNAECVTCHNGTLANLPHSFATTTGVVSSSGHNTTEYGRVGAYSMFDGSQGPTLHAINATTGVTVGVVNTTWATPTVDTFWASNDASASANAQKGHTWNDVITCKDCHTGLNAGGPHGQSDNWGIDPNFSQDWSYAELSKQIETYPSGMKVRSDLTTHAQSYGDGGGYASTIASAGVKPIICAKCHDLENYINPSVIASGVAGGNVAHNSHHQDQTDGSPQCVNCHVYVPHGWKRPRLLVDTSRDQAPYLSANHLGTSRTNNGVTMVNGWNKMGEQSLSADDTHTIVTIASGATLVWWTEGGCDGCDEHGAGGLSAGGPNSGNGSNGSVTSAGLPSWRSFPATGTGDVTRIKE